MTATTRPAARLGEELAAARRRGETFAVAWPAALAAALACARGPREHAEWGDVFRDLRSVWCQAFERRGSGRGLGGLLTEDHDQPVEERLCAHCHGEIPEERQASAIYCSADCKRAARGAPLAAVA